MHMEPIELFLSPAGGAGQSLSRRLSARALAETGDVPGGEDNSLTSHLDPGGGPDSLRDQGWAVIAPRGEHGDHLLALVATLLRKRAEDQEVGEASLEALAEKYHVDTHRPWAWKGGYTAASRRALAAMRDAARRAVASRTQETDRPSIPSSARTHALLTVASRLALVLAGLTILAPSEVLAQSPAKKMVATLVAEPPNIDGKLDESVWQRAAFVTDFVQKEPNEGGTPSQRTEVTIAYDRDALYVGARMHVHAPAYAIQGVMTRHDDLGTAERIVVSLDTFHNRRTASSFAVTAAGVRADWYHWDDNEASRDDSFNPVWTAKTAVAPDGWTAEMRIPLTQLRFLHEEHPIWGVNVNRYIPQLNEDIYWAVVPKDESGWASYFGELHGLDGIRQPVRLELRPYLIGELQTTSRSLVADDDPFAERFGYAGRAGLDMKAGLGPNLTLDATILPDFAQSEADPAQVNLTAFETFFEERRPFFIEGSELLQGQGATLYHSRRIGAPPRGDADGDYVDFPGVTPILGAAKLTGVLPSRLSIGTLAAVSGRAYADTYDVETDTRDRVEVSPLTSYGLVRLQQEFGPHASRVAAVLTAVNRTIEDGTPSADEYVAQAYTGGVDGVLRFADAVYEVSGFAGFSHLRGSSAAITAIARNSAHYFQRPDLDHVSWDPDATSLSGHTAGAELRKRKGSWRWFVSPYAESPGYEPNDLGRMRTADDLTLYGGLSYQQTRPGHAIHAWTTGFENISSITYGGERYPDEITPFGEITWSNFWKTTLRGLLLTPGHDDAITRGGPLMGTGWGGNVTLSTASSDAARNRWEGSITHAFHQTGERGFTASATLSLIPMDRLRLSLAPSYRRTSDNRQYLDTIAGGNVSTYGNRYVFGTIDRRELAMQVRMQLALSPNLAVDLYAEPFLSSGRYSSLGELSAPRSRDLVLYGQEQGAIAHTGGEGYRISIDGQEFEIPDPDFTVLSLRSTLSVRWEFLPGSTMFIIWQQDRLGERGDVHPVTPLALQDAFSRAGHNVVALKLVYWWSGIGSLF
jgi:hypothetical protein